MRDRSTQAFIAGGKLRPIDRILDQADLMFRYRSSILDGSSNNESSNDASLTNLASPVNLITAILCEWRYALNWLVRYHDQDWDELTTEAGSCDG